MLQILFFRIKNISYICSMKKLTIDKRKVLESVNKMVSDKNTVQLFLKGEITTETLRQKGITLANPL
ncbi:hypothetical protein BSF42_39030 [Flavobacterium sp. ACN6]|nr:hypothetical protein BSF42_39030 [Flavobacterium sp. ACN6]